MQAYIASKFISNKAWPGKLSFAILFAGTDFRCPFYNPLFVDFKEEYLCDVKDIKREIDYNLEYIEAIVFSGGEPCLQKLALLDFARFCKKLKLKTCLKTNGTKPNCIKTLLNEKLIDYIALDIRSPFEENAFQRITKATTFFTPAKSIMRNIKESIELLKIESFKDNIDIEIRTTIIPGLMYRKEDILNIASYLQGMNSIWYLTQFKPKPGKMLDKKLENISPPTREFLLNLKEAVIKKYPKTIVEVRAD